MAFSILSSFWMDSIGSLKISIGCIEMILCVVMLLTLGMIVPHHVNKVPYLGRYTILIGLKLSLHIFIFIFSFIVQLQFGCRTNSTYCIHSCYKYIER